MFHHLITRSSSIVREGLCKTRHSHPDVATCRHLSPATRGDKASTTAMLTRFDTDSVVLKYYLSSTESARSCLQLGSKDGHEDTDDTAMARARAHFLKGAPSNTTNHTSWPFDVGRIVSALEAFLSFIQPLESLVSLSQCDGATQTRFAPLRPVSGCVCQSLPPFDSAGTNSTCGTTPRFSLACAPCCSAMPCVSIQCCAALVAPMHLWVGSPWNRELPAAASSEPKRRLLDSLAAATAAAAAARRFRNTCI